MGIQHIEDLPLPEFVKAVKNIGQMHATEKLDGANLWMGLDDKGRLITSREGKRKHAQNFYAENEYPHFAAYNGFRSAHAALQAKEAEISKIMQPGQTVELEILYGRQPNAVTYGLEGKSYIAFLRGVNGTPNVVADQLAMALGGQSVKVDADIIDSPDGVELNSQTTNVTYQFTGGQKIDPTKLKDANFKKHLEELETFLKKPAGIEGLTTSNYELLVGSLGSIPVAVRPQAKQLKAELLAKIMTDFKLPIKKELLDNYVNKIMPTLGDPDVTSDEDVGIEGVVLRDPTTDEMIKIVDKDAFTTINTFNHAIRNQISGVVKTLDGNAPLEARGGILGNMKIQIADLMGNKELARGGAAKKALEAAKGGTPEETIKNLAANLSIEDFHGTKRKILALMAHANKELSALRMDFQEHQDQFQLKLKSGRVIGLSPEIIKRTLLVFAESRKNLVEQFDRVKKAKTPAQVVAIFYGHNAKAVHGDDDNSAGIVQTTESLIAATSALLEKKEKKVKPKAALEKKPLRSPKKKVSRKAEKPHVVSKIDTDTKLYHNKDAYTLMNVYFATVFMSVLMYQAGDAKGIRLLRDKTHYRMQSYATQMSPLNFWGYPIWHSSAPAVKKLIGVKAANALYAVVRRAPASASRYLHMDLSFGRDVPIEWTDHRHTLRLLMQLQGMNVDRINTLMDGIFIYDTLDHDAKVKLIGKLYYYVAQFIPTSPLFIRLKAIQSDLLLNANDNNDEMVQEMKLLAGINSLVEDGEGAAGSTVSQVDLATRAADASSTNGVNSIKKGRMIIRRPRNPAIKLAKFPKPADAAV